MSRSLGTSIPKTIEIVAGPNGSGKTTFANVYVLEKLGRAIYLNPDKIASGIAPIDFEKASFHAGRVLISEVKSMIANGESFSFESTLSGRTWLAILKDALDKKYKITIYFLYLDSVQRNLQRIKRRVQLGGHPIPADAVYRRHPRCFHNFWHFYRPFCCDWYVFNNSRKKPVLLQSKLEFENLSVRGQTAFIDSFLKGKMP